jgi:hypothetical protein
MLGHGAQTVLNIFPIQLKLFAPGIDASKCDMDVGMFCVEVRHRHPIERCVEIGFHSTHDVPRQSLQVEALAELG